MEMGQSYRKYTEERERVLMKLQQSSMDQIELFSRKITIKYHYHTKKQDRWPTIDNESFEVKLNMITLLVYI